MCVGRGEGWWDVRADWQRGFQFHHPEAKPEGLPDWLFPASVPWHLAQGGRVVAVMNTYMSTFPTEEERDGRS